MLEVFLACWLTILVKDSRHAGSLLGLLVYYLSEGFKAFKAGWEFTILVKDSRHAGSWPVYYLSEGFKACWESSWSAGLLS